MLDVRFLPNPHYREDLRPLTGRDPAVVAHVEAGDWRDEFYDRLLPMLDFLLPAYVAEGKTHLTLAIGCTGGRHRSVCVADRIARHLDGREDVSPACRPPRRRAELSATDRGRRARGGSEFTPMSEAGHLRRGACASPTASSRPCAASTSRSPRGEIFAFVGPNGAGKTTTVEILEGYRGRTAGEATVLGADPAAAGASGASGSGSCSRSAACSRSSPCARRSSQFAGYYRRPRPVDETIELVGLSEKADARAGQALGRPAAPPRRRAGADRRPGAALPRRADDGLRPHGAPPGVGDDREPARAGQDGVPDHPLHGGGAGARRPGGDHRPRPDRRPGAARRARRRGGRRGRGQLPPPGRASRSTSFRPPRAAPRERLGCAQRAGRAAHGPAPSRPSTS